MQDSITFLLYSEAMIEYPNLQ